jgi:hypothetical protein
MNIIKTLEKKAKKEFRGYPVATIGWYGPTNKLATKVAVGIIMHKGAEPVLMQWHSETDIRENADVLKEVLAMIKNHEAKSVAIINKIIGCPHEQGIDYHDDYCPECPFWINRDRFAD